jgi:GLPGLI family protein
MKFFAIILLIISSLCFAQGGRVTYKYISNGIETDMPRLNLTSSAATNISHFSNSQGEDFFFDYNFRKTYQSFVLKNSGRITTRITTIENFGNYPQPELTGDTATILGYLCRKATVVIRSNHIDLWYTTGAGIKGSPALNLGPELGLVLRVVRNNNFEIVAEKIDVLDMDVNMFSDMGEIIDAPTYKEKVTENNFTTVRIFTDEKINFGDTIVNPQGDIEGITYRWSKGTVILKKVTLPENMQGNIVYAELTERSGGDAYDRTGTLFVIPDTKSLSFLDAFKNGIDILPEYESNSKKIYRGFTLTDLYRPPVELMRFFTPFGIGHYNSQVTVKGISWEDSVTYRQDVTDLLGVLEGEMWIGVFIGCYDKGGHRVSLKLKYHPDDPDAKNIPQKKYWVQPVINTVNIMEMSSQEYPTVFLYDTLTVTVDIPKGIKNLKLRYISTGHGGWGGGDEFNKKMNEIFIDDKQVYKYIPWRDDCGMYRKYNPASGNFPNGISSSDYSRSGWCPGSTGVPVDIPLNNLRAGKHTIKVYIPMGKPEGTSSSAWNVSAVLIADYND